MKLNALVILGLVLIGLVGCGSTITKANEEVIPGMTAAQVTSLLGGPTNRSFNGTYEAWQYDGIAGFGVGFSQCEYITIWFDNEIVQSMTSRRGSSKAGCEQGSETVNWDQMPDSTATKE
jgi:hypothetical protein